MLILMADGNTDTLSLETNLSQTQVALNTECVHTVNGPDPVVKFQKMLIVYSYLKKWKRKWDKSIKFINPFQTNGIFHKFNP